MKRIQSIVVAAFVLVATVALLVPSTSVDAQSSAALSITPEKEYNVDPGGSVRDRLTIRNIDDERPLQLSLRVVDFTFLDDSGAPKLDLEESAPETAWSIRSYMDVPEYVEVGAGETTSVDINLTMPEGIGGGSYYSAIVYSSGASEGGNVGLSASGVTLAFVNVSGPVNEELELTKFGAYFPAVGANEAHYAKISSDMPQHIGYTLLNKGNVAEAPVGTITMRSMFGQEIVINEVNPKDSLALIGQERTFQACIQIKAEEIALGGSRTNALSCEENPGLWPGYYSISVDLFYGQNGNQTQEIHDVTYFWYMPWWFVVTLLIALAVIAYFIWRLTLKIRHAFYGHRYKKTARSSRGRRK